MRWQGQRESENVEDRRDQQTVTTGTGGLSLPRGKAGMVILVVVLVAGYYGYDLTPLLGGNSQGQVFQPASNIVDKSKDNQAARFTSVILASTEDVWSDIFGQMKQTYQPPKLVMYRGATRTGCGTGQSVIGPFYCPSDKTVYIDLSFYDEMQQKLAAGGEFAQGYVIAHEVGHHVQNLLGIESKVREQMQRTDSIGRNKLSVRLELQADCFAGIWGQKMQQKNILEQGDLQQALQAAEAIGDDKLQQQSQGRIVPDSFTHGTSQQRYSWFKRGFAAGDLAQCDTFSSPSL